MAKKKTAPAAAARPRKPKGNPILSMRVPADFIARIDKWATKKGQSRSAAIRALIDLGLKR